MTAFVMGRLPWDIRLANSPEKFGSSLRAGGGVVAVQGSQEPAPPQIDKFAGSPPPANYQRVLTQILRV